MSMKKITTNSAKETREVAAKFAWQILRHKPGKNSVVLGLKGDLGAGKTTFLQGFARGLGIKEKILSPTFIIMKTFQIPAIKTKNHPYQKIRSSVFSGRGKFKCFYHFDCYRLNNPEEILDLGFKEIISNPENIVAIEWPEKISTILPRNIISIQLEHGAENQRTLTIKK